jgi:hypothetical protein
MVVAKVTDNRMATFKDSVSMQREGITNFLFLEICQNTTHRAS